MDDSSGARVSFLLADAWFFPRSMAFNYLQREVPPGYEHTLAIYYQAKDGDSWVRLDTQVDLDGNQATAVMPDDAGWGQGILCFGSHH